MYVDMTKEKALEIMGNFKHCVSCSRSGNFFKFVHHEWTGGDCSVTNSIIHAGMLKDLDAMYKKVHKDD